jgi:hypothetical protein
MLLDDQICPSVMSLKTTTCHFSSVAVRIGEGGKVYRRQTFFLFSLLKNSLVLFVFDILISFLQKF